MTAPQTTSASYEVGYRKPPRHTQFQKGQSGNPGGRPRRSPARRLEELALYEAYRPTIVMEDGHAVPMPAIQAVLRSQLQSAASGNVRAQRDILAMIRDIELVRDVLGRGSADDDGVDADDADDAADNAGDADDADNADDADDNDGDDNDIDDAADADGDDAGSADDDEPARQHADGIDMYGERKQAEPEPVELVARVERSETREHPFNAHRRPRVSLALNPGYSEARRLRRPQSAPRSRKTPRPRRPGGRLRCRPAQEAGNGEAFCPAATVPNGAQVSSPHGRSPGGPAAVRRSTPAKSGRGVAEARGVRRAGGMPDPARPRLQADTRRPPLPNETKN